MRLRSIQALQNTDWSARQWMDIQEALVPRYYMHLSINFVEKLKVLRRLYNILYTAHHQDLSRDPQKGADLVSVPLGNSILLPSTLLVASGSID